MIRDLRPRALAVATAFALLMTSIASPIGAAPVMPLQTSSVTAASSVALDKGAVAVPNDGDFAFNVSVQIDRPTSYLESRVQIRRPDGRLLYQKTEIRHEVPTGTVSIGYRRDIADLSLRPDAYPVEVRVRSDAQGEVREWIVNDDLLVYDPDVDPVRVAVVARITAPPLLDPSGRFSADPTEYGSAREDAESLAAFVMSEPEATLSLALPPLLAEEWLRASEGYDIAAPDGVLTVPPDTEGPLAYRSTLNLLKSAVGSQRLELMDIPYADPDPWGLAEMDRDTDLASHFERGTSAYRAALEATPSAATMLAGGGLTPDQATVVRARGKHVVLVAPESLEDTEVASADLGGGLLANPVDPVLSAALASSEATTFARAVFDRHLARETTTTVVAVADLGLAGLSFEAVEQSVRLMESSPWVDFVTVSEYAGAGTERVTLAETMPPLTVQPPTGHWAIVEEARRASDALVEAAGPEDPDARRAADASLVSESAMWSGPDESWSLGERALVHATAATRLMASILGDVRVTASDVTLSSAQGEVPVIVSNPSGKDLTVSIRSVAQGLVVPSASSQDMVLRPGDNYLTVPVDLQSSIAGSLKMEVRSADLVISEAQVSVRASYLDRLAIVGGVTMLLGVLLLFIRKRARHADVHDRDTVP